MERMLNLSSEGQRTWCVKTWRQSRRHHVQKILGANPPCTQCGLERITNTHPRSKNKTSFIALTVLFGECGLRFLAFSGDAHVLARQDQVLARDPGQVGEKLAHTDAIDDPELVQMDLLPSVSVKGNFKLLEGSNRWVL